MSGASRRLPEGAEPVQPALVRRLRHDLRTPIAHILGYAELMEEAALEEGRDEALPPIRALHAVGEQLFSVASAALDSAVALDAVALHRLAADLERQLVSLAEIQRPLMERAEAAGDRATMSDLEKIALACARLKAVLDEVCRGGTDADAPSVP